MLMTESTRVLANLSSSFNSRETNPKTHGSPQQQFKGYCTNIEAVRVIAEVTQSFLTSLG